MKFEDIERILSQISPQVLEITKILEESGAVLPLTVTNCGFMDILDDEPQGGIPKGHSARYKTYEEAAKQYAFMVYGFETGADKLITHESYIADSNGVKVYPK